MSVSVNSGTPQWLNVSDVFPMPTTYAPWKPLPALSTTLLVLLFSAGVAVVYDRKELK
jgi:hypothetical protein